MTQVLVALFLGSALLAAQVPQAPPPNPNPPFFKGDREKDKDPNARYVEGTVKDVNDNPVDGAVVKLKDTKSLQVRSFITKSDGRFGYSGLRKDIEYELRADAKGLGSEMKTVSVFDSRKVVILNLKLEEKK